MLHILRIFLLFSVLLRGSNGRASIESRVESLLSQMTLDEKIYQLISWQYFPPITFDNGIGQLRSNGDSPQAMISWHNTQQEKIVNSSRLGIPASFHQETLHSACAGCTVFPMPIAQGCTWNVTLINNIASIIAKSARSVGSDILYSPVINLWIDPRFGRISEGFSSNPTLTAHMARESVQGFQGKKNSENSENSKNFPKNKNSKNSKNSKNVKNTKNTENAFTYLEDDKGIALGKHYAGYGCGIGGLNAAPCDVSMRTIFEIFLKPWKSFANAGGRGVMTSHQTINRIPMHANKYFVNDILRDRFGFKNGQIISDCNDIGVLQWYRISSNRTQSAALALNAGVDMDLICSNPSSNGSFSGPYLYLSEALSHGWINETTLNNSVSRILAGKFATGLFDNNTYVTDIHGWKNIINTQSNIDLAYQAAVESITILKSNNNIYSLKSQFESNNLKNLAIIGPNGHCLTIPKQGELCDTKLNYLGPYTNENSNITVSTLYESFLESNKYNTSLNSIKFTKGVDIQSNNISDINNAIKIAQESDAIILVLGDSVSTCGEWQDNNNLNLPGLQNDLLLTIIENTRNYINSSSSSSSSDIINNNNNNNNRNKGNGPNKNITLIVVLIGGRPFTFNNDINKLGNNNFILNNIDLLINVYRPGQMGGIALRDIIMGDIENTGRLSQSWPMTVGDILSGSQPFLQEIRGKWIANKESTSFDYDGRIYDSYQNEKKFSNINTIPLFEFGYGLSNTGCLPNMFIYSNLNVNIVNNTNIQNDDSIVMKILINVENICKYNATDIIQIYLIDTNMDGMNNKPLLVRYWKRLIAFEKFSLNSGQSKIIEMNVRFDDIAIYIDDEYKKFEIVHGMYTVRAGQSSRMDKLYVNVQL